MFMDSFGRIRCWSRKIGRGRKRDLCRALSISGLSLGSSYAVLWEGESLTVLLQGLPYWIPHCVEYDADRESGISIFSGVCLWDEGFGRQPFLKRLWEEHGSFLFGDSKPPNRLLRPCLPPLLALFHTRPNHAAIYRACSEVVKVPYRGLHSARSSKGMS